MNSNCREDILVAMERFLEPVAEFLLRAGVSYQEFEELAKAAFVSTAVNKFGVRGRATNVSRVAVMTGLSRKEISKIRENSLTELTAKRAPASPAAMVLAGWHTNDSFVDDYGRPLPLSFELDAPSFSDLVRIYAGDVPAGAVRSELKRAGAIAEDEHGKLVAHKRYFVPSKVDEKLASSIGTMLYGLAATIANNSNSDRTGEGRIQRFVYSDSLSPPAIKLFRNIARQRAEQLVENLDDWLGSNQGLPISDLANSTQVARRVGVGVYYFEEDPQFDGDDY